MAKAAQVRNSLRRQLHKHDASELSLYLDGPRQRVRFAHGRTQVTLPVSQASAAVAALDASVQGPAAVLSALEQSG